MRGKSMLDVYLIPIAQGILVLLLAVSLLNAGAGH